jgi:hypothetical protein
MSGRDRRTYVSGKGSYTMCPFLWERKTSQHEHNAHLATAYQILWRKKKPANRSTSIITWPIQQQSHRRTSPPPTLTMMPLRRRAAAGRIIHPCMHGARGAGGGRGTEGEKGFAPVSDGWAWSLPSPWRFGGFWGPGPWTGARGRTLS